MFVNTCIVLTSIWFIVYCYLIVQYYRRPARSRNKGLIDMTDEQRNIFYLFWPLIGGALALLLLVGGIFAYIRK